MGNTDLKNMIEDIQEMIVELSKHAGEHAVLAAKRLENAITSIEKQISIDSSDKEA